MFSRLWVLPWRIEFAEFSWFLLNTLRCAHSALPRFVSCRCNIYWWLFDNSLHLTLSHRIAQTDASNILNRYLADRILGSGHLGAQDPRIDLGDDFSTPYSEYFRVKLWGYTNTNMYYQWAKQKSESDEEVEIRNKCDLQKFRISSSRDTKRLYVLYGSYKCWWNWLHLDLMGLENTIHKMGVPPVYIKIILSKSGMIIGFLMWLWCALESRQMRMEKVFFQFKLTARVPTLPTNHLGMCAQINWEGQCPPQSPF